MQIAALPFFVELHRCNNRRVVLHRALPSNFLPSKIKYGNGNYIIMGTLNRYWFVNQFVAISKDGINWTDLKKVTDESINDFCFITE